MVRVKKLNKKGMSTLSISLIIGALVTAAALVYPHAISSLATHSDGQFKKVGGAFLTNHQQASTSQSFSTSRTRPVDFGGTEISTNGNTQDVYEVVSASAGYSKKEDFAEATGPATQLISDTMVADKLDPYVGLRKPKVN